ncbi:MAG TPA: hypothetical protein VFA37_07935 [Gaiellaceae bacterium]|nr:hypothetical protein [Gaiellaceae bacterium]
MKRLSQTLGLLSTAALLTVGVASAASLGIGTGKLSAGNHAVSGCASAALTATRNVNNSGDVTAVNVLSVPQACSGQTLAVTLENASHASLGSATATVGTCTGGCTVSLSGFGTVLASNLASYAFSLTAT